MPASPLQFDNFYARDLPGFSVPWHPATVPAPDLLFFNRDLALELGLDPDVLDGPDGASIFAGNRVPEGAEPLAQAYAGHQFGGFSPQLGDGRALLLGTGAARSHPHGTPSQARAALSVAEPGDVPDDGDGTTVAGLSIEAGQRTQPGQYHRPGTFTGTLPQEAAS